MGLLDAWGYLKKFGNRIPGLTFGGVENGIENVKDGIGDAFKGNENSEFRTPNKENFDLPGFGARDSMLNGWAQDAYNRPGSDFRGDQRALVDRLMRQMNGVDSMSAAHLRRGADANMAQQRSFAASAGPANMAMATRMAMQNAGRAQQDLASQTAMAGIAERNAAAAQMGNVLAGARGQDLSEQQARDQAAMGYAGLGLQNAGMQQNGTMGYEAQRGQRFASLLGLPTTGERVISGFGDALKLWNR